MSTNRQIGSQCKQPSGASEANALGLATQVPTREVLLTSGASRTLQLGDRRVAFEHAKPWLGPVRGTLALPALHQQLSGEEWVAMRSARSMLPSWLARAVSELI